ncbi:MAG TPA: hypothetical protein VGK17_09595 [Propionicimonas sp.]|jgi:hypothetical protein
MEVNPPNQDARNGALQQALLFDRPAFVELALTDGADLQPLPRGALKDALRGALPLSAEYLGGVTDPRDEFVELELAAYCAHAGITVRGFDDVALEFEGCRYAVWCKRPFRRESLDANIEKGYLQLRERLQDGGRGIVGFRPCAADQSLLFPSSPREWLPEGHLAFFIADTVAALDLTAFYALDDGDGRRNQPFDPHMMVTVLLCAYPTGCRRG